MPTLFLSPSTQDWNMYITGSGSEEYNMNLLADDLIPYLNSNAIRYTRNDPEGTAADAIRLGNAEDYDFYLALHSNASPESIAGQTRGIIAFYYPGSPQGHRAAELFAEELREVYPRPSLVTTRPSPTLGELRQSRAPAVLVEIGYHDNYADANWLEESRPEIALALARALTRYFGIPFVYPVDPTPAVVQVNYGTLNLRDYPSAEGVVIANMPDGAAVTIYGEWQGWYVVHYAGLAGYAAAAYIDLR